MERFKNILLALGPWEEGQEGLQRAISLAEANQAALTVLRVVPKVTAGIGMPDGGPISRELQASLVYEHEERLKNMLAPYQERLSIEIRVVTGIPFIEFIRQVQRARHDLLIKQAEEADWLDTITGSDDMHVLRKAPCPVWLIKSDTPRQYRRILAAVDVDSGSLSKKDTVAHDMNMQILEMASSLAIAESSELHVVHVWEAIGLSAMRSVSLSMGEDEIEEYQQLVRRQSSEALERLTQELGEKLGEEAMGYLDMHTHLVQGQPRRELLSLAKELDVELMVMGTVARTGIPGFIIGNTAETVLSHINCSILATKPRGFQTPVLLEE